MSGTYDGLGPHRQMGARCAACALRLTDAEADAYDLALALAHSAGHAGPVPAPRCEGCLRAAEVLSDGYPSALAPAELTSAAHAAPNL